MTSPSLKQELRIHFERTADLSVDDGQLETILLRTSAITPRRVAPLRVIGGGRRTALLLVAALLLVGALATAVLSGPWRGQPAPARFPSGSIAWSRDGALMLSQPDGTRSRVLDEPWAAGPGGSAPPPAGPADAPFAFAFGADGRSLTYESGMPVGSRFTTVGADGTRLASFTLDTDAGVRWSLAPDGHRIAVLTDAPNGLSVLGLDGSLIHRPALPAGFIWPGMGLPMTAPMWSPDGNRIVVIGCIDPCDQKTGTYRAVVSDLTTGSWAWVGGQTTLSARVAAWSPDGARLALGLSCAGGCAGPGTVELLDPTGAVASSFDLPADLGPEMLAWSPEGTGLAIGAWPDTWTPPWSLVFRSSDGSIGAHPMTPRYLIGMAWAGDRLLFGAYEPGPDEGQLSASPVASLAPPSPTIAPTPPGLWSIDAATGIRVLVIDDVGYAFAVAP